MKLTIISSHPSKTGHINKLVDSEGKQYYMKSSTPLKGQQDINMEQHSIEPETVNFTDNNQVEHTAVLNWIV